MNEDIKKILIALMANDVAFHYEPVSCEDRGGYIINAKNVSLPAWEVDEPNSSHDDIRFYPFLHRKNFDYISNPPVDFVVDAILNPTKYHTIPK